jgi:tetratricopeptide (TPR) repeat protein
VEALAEQAERHAAAGMIGDAEAALQQARVLSPRSPRVERAAAVIARAREAAQQKAMAPAPAAKAKPALTAAEQRQADELYTRALDAFGKGRRDQGLRYLELVYDMDPAHPGVVAGLKREYLALGLEAFTNSQLPEAVSAWEKALKVDPSDPRTAAYLLRAQQHLARSRQIGGAP